MGNYVSTSLVHPTEQRRLAMRSVLVYMSTLGNRGQSYATSKEICAALNIARSTGKKYLDFLFDLNLITRSVEHAAYVAPIISGGTRVFYFRPVENALPTFDAMGADNFTRAIAAANRAMNNGLPVKRKTKTSKSQKNSLLGFTHLASNAADAAPVSPTWDLHTLFYKKELNNAAQ